MLDLLCEVARRAGAAPRLARLVKDITQLTQNALSASASSVLLLDESKKELLFEVAEGEASKTLRQARLSARSGIAGWVASHGKPLIVNDVSSDRRFNQSVDAATGFVTRSTICAPLLLHSKVIGVIEVLNKADGGHFSQHDMETLVSVASTAAISVENVRLHQTLLGSYKSTIKALVAAMEAKDPYTCGHSQRVMEYALLGGASLPSSNEDMEALEYAGVLHDIGKIGVADSILAKPGPLTDDEWQMVRGHPLTGANILNGIPFLDKSRSLILHHHERYDGKGYPDGLKGDDIPIGARLLAVADAFDTMTTDRAYRSSMGRDYAIDELYNCSGKQFCPVAVSAFLSGFNKCHDLAT
ncbi:MAG: HD domain-containing phosphohydrolase [Chloroflexota bacterium]